MKKLFFLSLLLLTACTNEEHLTVISANEHYFNEWQNFAEPYAEDDELNLEQINEKIDADETYYKATVETDLATIAAYQGAELLWEDFYRSGEHFARTYHLTGGPYLFAELDRQTPYEMIDETRGRILLDVGLPVYKVTFTDPLTPLYTITKVGPLGKIWEQTINNDSIELTWLTEILPETTHTIDVVIPEKGATLPKKIYTNLDYGFSFEFPAYAFPLYDKNGNETENRIAQEVTVTEIHVSANESQFTLGGDGVLTVLKLKTDSETELNQAIKEHWGYFCEYTSSVGTEIGFDSIVWNVTAGANSFSCPGGTAWFDPKSKTLYLSAAGEEALFGYNDLRFSLTPDNLQLLNQ